MAPTTLLCPHCHQGLKLSRSPAAGQQVRCPQCGEHFPFVKPKAIQASVSQKKPAKATWMVAVGAGAALLLGITAGGFLLAQSWFGSEKLPPESELQAKSSPIVVQKEKAKPKEPATPPDVTNPEKEKQPEKDKKPVDPPGKEEKPGTQPPDPPLPKQPKEPPPPPEHEKYIEAGRAKLKDKQYDAAIDAFQMALKLSKNNQEALDALNDAVSAKLASIQEEQKKQDYTRFLDKAKTALSTKKWAVAIVLLEEAKLLAPEGDATAQQLLESAQKGLGSEKQQKALLQEYRDHLKKGQAALKQNRLPEAQAEFLMALDIVPDSKTALKHLRQLQPQTPTFAPIPQPTGFVPVLDLLIQGGRALQAGHYLEAASAFNAVLQFDPNNLQARVGLQEALARLYTPPVPQVTAAIARGNRIVDDAIRKSILPDGFIAAERMIDEALKVFQQAKVTLWDEATVYSIQRATALKTAWHQKNAADKAALTTAEGLLKKGDIQAARKTYEEALPLTAAKRAADIIDLAGRSIDPRKLIKEPTKPSAKYTQEKKQGQAAMESAKPNYGKAAAHFQAAFRDTPTYEALGWQILASIKANNIPQKT